jgi:hypothetical protein
MSAIVSSRMAVDSFCSSCCLGASAPSWRRHPFGALQPAENASGANFMDGRETECRRSLADQAASTAVDIYGAVLLSARSLPNANWPFLMSGASLA